MKRNVLNVALIFVMLFGGIFAFSGCGKKDEEKQNVIDYKEKLKIGDYIAYDEGKGSTYVVDEQKSKVGAKKYTTTGNLKWRVFGFDDSGKVQLICDESIYCDDGTKSYNLKSSDDYSSILDGIAANYGKGNGAESARSIKIEDVKKYIKYDVEINDKNPLSRVMNYADDTTTEYEMLFKNEDGFYKNYLINSFGESNNSKFVYFFGGVGIGANTGYSSIGGVLPIVTLKPDVEITEKDENGIWQIKGTDKKYKEENYIKISNAQDYMKLVNGEYGLDKNYILTNDIDLSGIENLQSIANPKDGKNQYFSGIFNGNNFSIKGAKMSITKDGNAGLFYATNGATIKNLNISNSEILIVKNDENNIKTQYIGTLVGEAKKTKIINCTVDGKIQDSVNEENIELLQMLRVGMLAGDISDSSNVYKTYTKGSIRSKANYSSSGFSNVISGSFVERCGANVNIETDLGNAIGFSSYVYNATILKSYNTGNLKSYNTKSNWVVGFVQSLSNRSKIIQCYSKCDISGCSYVYGFCEREETAGSGDIYDSYNSGKIMANNETYGHIFAGSVSTSPDIHSSYTDATINKKENDTKGDLYYNNSLLKFKDNRGIGLTDTQFHQKESYKSFNFDYVWKWDEKEQKPRLLFEYE